MVLSPVEQMIIHTKACTKCSLKYLSYRIAELQRGEIKHFLEGKHLMKDSLLSSDEAIMASRMDINNKK